MTDHRQLPAFHSTQQLFLALHEATLAMTDGDRSGLASRLREAAVAAAAAIVRGSGLPDAQRLEPLREAEGRLRELAFLIDLARRLCYLDLGTAAELLELQTRASVELAALTGSHQEETALVSA